MILNKAREIEARVEITDVVRRYGAIEFNSRGYSSCPFHTEKTPSFTTHKGKYKCFGCGAYGGSIDFVMNMLGLSFKQALVRLDTDYGLHLIRAKLSPDDMKQAKADICIAEAEKAFKERIMDNYDRQCTKYRAIKRYFEDHPEEWISELILELEEALDDFTGEGARRWMT